MNEELTKKLYDKYPKIFSQKDLPETKTCMCWGVECGDGWYNLIDNLCSLIQSHCDWKINHLNYKKKHEGIDFNASEYQCEAVQVKEKFGGLRFYVENYEDDYISGLISMAERMSEDTCINCGSNHNVKMTTGWITPLCEKCFKKDSNV